MNKDHPDYEFFNEMSNYLQLRKRFCLDHIHTLETESRHVPHEHLAKICVILNGNFTVVSVHEFYKNIAEVFASDLLETEVAIRELSQKFRDASLL